jgi:hypothetical protein
MWMLMNCDAAETTQGEGETIGGRLGMRCKQGRWRRDSFVIKRRCATFGVFSISNRQMRDLWSLKALRAGPEFVMRSGREIDAGFAATI